jgi:hypothetical protein
MKFCEELVTLSNFLCVCVVCGIHINVTLLICIFVASCKLTFKNMCLCVLLHVSIRSVAFLSVIVSVCFFFKV